MHHLARTLRVLLVGSATIAIALLVGIAPATAARAHPAPGITLDGQVTLPATYTGADLAALPQTTLPDQRTNHPAPDLTGVLLEPLVTAAGPQTPAAKNAELRVTVTITGRHDATTVALGELLPRFGNHPALLIPGSERGHRGTDLVFPGDRGHRRTVHDVHRITVAVADPTLPTGLPAGALNITTGHRQITLTAGQLSRLPAITRAVTFASGSGQQTHTETGPTLATVLRAARIRTTPTTAVAALATDSYVATITPAEATSGRRHLLISLTEDGAPLAQPRLVVDGDLAGGRYVSGVVRLDLTPTCPTAKP